MVDGDGGAGQFASGVAAAQVLIDDQIALECLGAAGLELLEAEVVALDQEGPALLVDEAVVELAAVGVALQEAGGDAAVLRDVGDALEGGEPAVDPAAEDQEQRNVHDPDAEPGVAPALGEDEAWTRYLCPASFCATCSALSAVGEAATLKRSPAT